MPRVLIVEDDAAVSASIQAVVAGLGHEVVCVPSAELALDEARAAPPALVLLDVNLPGRTGIDALPDLLAVEPAPTVVVMTAEPTAENAIDAMARGAVEHLSKPLDPDALQALVQRLLADRVGVADGPAEAAKLVGSSLAMLELGRRVGALARTESTVLIRGESGTGKELVARAIHERSPRGEGPFVPVSCAALPEGLVESELFGHVEGAFTGARGDRVGYVERAAGGTLFLDEVGELTAAAQGKLLRFLEERTFERVGDTAPRRADVRVVAATNAPLEDQVDEGTFREDLFYRLDVTRVSVPPLRERTGDLPALVEHFLARAGRPGVRIGTGVLDAIRARAWPGNVRELHNAVASALASLGSGKELRVEHLPAAARVSPAPQGAGLEGAVAEAVRAGGDELFARLKADLERSAIATALELTGGNQVAAAAHLGMNRATFRRKMSDHGLS